MTTNISLPHTQRPNQTESETLKWALLSTFPYSSSTVKRFTISRWNAVIQRLIHLYFFKEPDDDEENEETKGVGEESLQTDLNPHKREYLPMVYVAPSIWNVALLHFLKSFDPRPGILTVRVGLEAVACRIIVAPPSSAAELALALELSPVTWLVRDTDLPLNIEGRCWFGELVRAIDFLVVTFDVVDAVVGVFVNDGVVFIEANNETDCEFEASDGDELINRSRASATEGAVVDGGKTVEFPVCPVVVGGVVTQSRLLLTDFDIFTLSSLWNSCKHSLAAEGR